MKTAWIKGLTNEEKEEMKLLFSSNARLRNKIIELVEEKANSAQKANTLKDAYDSPNWALKQADAVGYQRACEEIISLLK